MDALASAGAELVFFGLSLGLMQFALRRGGGGGLFRALPWGLLPAFLLALAQFWTLQQPDLAEAKAERAQWAQAAQAMIQREVPGKDEAQAKERASLAQLYQTAGEAMPAGQFCLALVVLAPLAVWLRRRQFRRGLATDPGPLGRWSAPWGLVWLVLAPGFWLAARHYTLAAAPAWADHLAMNVVVVGVTIFLFQGLVVLAAKLAAWARNPRTRGLALIFAAGVVFSLFTGGLALLQMFGLMLLVTGLLEPWADLRHLNNQGRAKRGA